MLRRTLSIAALGLAVPISALLFISAYQADSAQLLIGAALTSLFIYGFWDYAAAEWPYSVRLSALAFYSLLIVLMFFAAPFSELQLAVAAAVLVAVTAVLGGMKILIATQKWWSAPYKIVPVALMIAIPLAWPVVALYEAGRMWSRGAKAAAAAVFLSLALIPMMLVSPADLISAGLYNGLAAVPVWLGTVGWEELISRALLYIVGPYANYTFVVLHASTRLLDALWLAPSILSVISFATRYLTYVYEQGGLAASVIAHAIYDAYVGLFLLLPVSGEYFLLSLFAAVAYYFVGWAHARR